MPTNNNAYSDLNKYFQDFMMQFYGSKPLETEYEGELFKRQQQLLDERRRRSLSRVMSRLAAQGIEGSGVGSQFITEQVEEPIAQAEAQLDWDRLQRMESERLRREVTALGAAQQKLAEEEAARQRRSGLLGRLAGGAISGGILGFMKGGPWGAAAGAAIGGLGGFMGPPEMAGGGAGGYQNMYMQLLMDYYNRLQQGQLSTGYTFPSGGYGPTPGE